MLGWLNDCVDGGSTFDDDVGDDDGCCLFHMNHSLCGFDDGF